METLAERTVGPGAKLKCAREEMGLSQKDISKNLHLTQHIIKLIEEDNYEHANSPNAAFLRGYLRSYAEIVRIPAEKIVDDFNQLGFNQSVETKLSRKKPALMILKEPLAKSFSRTLLLLGLFVSLGLAWYWMAHKDKPLNESLLTRPDVSIPEIPIKK